ncbi:Phosphatidylinositol 3,4,5-trisphosphate 5-phosphatase 1 [Hondaea fermentalgiana]|uniref:Phosphatidylinositol 3,4,5-trisphosphate 5-phosphatase 1 n=1 Tax=Hondaea fermentalgiana TaxID=2315210 RepID=A0A2R5G5N8_9STRA|nr:Phosphatidylinositol 3,4,5-trisphosphate 5-phosphatase 1 [Hondaea fermentalgiana]|eukprot:GBG26300.1 Phosphatidylinositol 3,4,5-trisphosphate 5-phosphatase 1 [Hondaea fermentalgiana]
MRGKSFVFVNSHFKGQPTDDASRDANFHEINVRFKLPLNKLQTTTPISQRFDFAWWLGDLNYRVHLDSMVPSVAESHKTTGAYCDKSVPSWTDRILVKRDQPECAWLSYGMLNAVCTSVHKPVFAAHAVTLAEPHGIWSDWHAAQAEFMKRVQAEADAAAKANVGVSAGTSKSIGLGAKVLGAKGKAKAAQQQEVSFRMDTEANANKSRACVIQ